MITTDLSREDGQTKVKVSQDNNASEEANAQAVKNWAMVLEGMKKVVETGKA